jgi:UDP-N-acetylglucosamine 2-epimerase
MRNGKIRVLAPIGVRPHAVKAACLAVCRLNFGVDLHFCLTGQQSNLFRRIVPASALENIVEMTRYELGAFSYQSTAQQIGRIIIDNAYENVLSIGDTKTSLCASIAAKVGGAKLFHYESGLRSQVVTIEEKIRRYIDRLSDVHLCYNTFARDNLLREGVEPDRIHTVGSLYEEALELATAIGSDFGRKYASGIVVALHRKENHVNAVMLKLVARHISAIPGKKFLVRHPSNEGAEVDEVMKSNDDWHIIEESNFVDFANLLRCAGAIITDSAGIAEQASLLGKPTIILRGGTERPWIVGAGTILSEIGELEGNVLRAMVLAHPKADAASSHVSEAIFLSLSKEGRRSSSLRVEC